MVPISAEQIPAGWQSVNIRVPSRIATCEETDCPAFLGGWSEVTPGGTTGSEVREGHITADEAAATFGLYGPKALAPSVVHHPAGTPCPRIHRTASGLPPIYIVDGRTVLWNEFEDAIAGGLETAHAIAG
jgi:hypothetical protein